MSRSVSAGFALLLAAMAPVACTGEPDEAQRDAGQTQAATDPDAPAGISVSEARMTLPAVSGNPGALYFTIANSGEADLTIASASITGVGMATFHQTVNAGGQARMDSMAHVPLPAGEEVALAPGGMHVMAMDLDDSFAIGGRTEATLTFDNGDKVSFPVEIVAPGSTGEGT